MRSIDLQSNDQKSFAFPAKRQVASADKLHVKPAIIPPLLGLKQDPATSQKFELSVYTGTRPPVPD